MLFIRLLHKLVHVTQVAEDLGDVLESLVPHCSCFLIRFGFFSLASQFVKAHTDFFGAELVGIEQ